jgi:hypothetical protein
LLPLPQLLEPLLLPLQLPPPLLLLRRKKKRTMTWDSVSLIK